MYIKQSPDAQAQFWELMQNQWTQFSLKYTLLYKLQNLLFIAICIKTFSL